MKEVRVAAVRRLVGLADTRTAVCLAGRVKYETPGTGAAQHVIYDLVAVPMSQSRSPDAQISAAEPLPAHFHRSVCHESVTTTL